MLEAWLDIYADRFGENYPLSITSLLTSEEIIAEIRECLERGTPAEPIEYEEGLIY